MSIASKDIFDPLKSIISADAEPILSDFLNAIQAASANLISKLPTQSQGLASVGANTVIGIAGILAQNEIAKLTNNVQTTPSVSPAP